ncbi:MAG: TIGR02678 family protein [Thermoanaerobaculia bacterium]
MTVLPFSRGLGGRGSASGPDPATAPPEKPEAAAEAEALAEERRRAVRLLLAHPLAGDTGPDPEAFALVRRHERWLQGWFADVLGYRLVVDAELARLHKRPAPGARPRPVRSLSGTPFDPRRYALACLVLAALERVDAQTILSELAEQVQVLAASEQDLRPFEPDVYAERQAFVDAVRWLVELGVLALADGDDTAFVEGRGDALYDVHGRRLGQVLAASVPPSLAAGPEELAAEPYPDTDEGANRRSRHRLMRRLLEEPVLFLDELGEAERAYLASQRHYLVRQAREAAGLEVEVRREGLAALDPAGTLSDLAFPAPGTVGHAALLLAEELARRAREAGGEARSVPHGEVAAFVEELLPRHRRLWSKRYAEEPGSAARLVADAVERLELMGLVAVVPEGVVARPAIARYESRDAAPPGGGDSGPSGDGLLDGQDDPAGPESRGGPAGGEGGVP